MLAHSSFVHHMLMTFWLLPEREMRSGTSCNALDLSHTLQMQSVIRGASKCACANVCAAVTIGLCYQKVFLQVCGSAEPVCVWMAKPVAILLFARMHL